MNTFNNEVYVSKKHGFTLVEVMVVVAIIAVLALFAGPEIMNWRPNMRLTDAAQDLYANMQNAKVAAVEQNARAIVSFDSNKQYSVFLDNGAGASTNNDTWDSPEEYVSFDEASNSLGPISLPADVVFDAGTNFSGSKTPGFNSRALPVAGRTGSVILTRTDCDVTRCPWYRITLGAAGSLTMDRKIGSGGVYK